MVNNSSTNGVNVGDVVTPEVNDVLSGRGRGVMLNAGNQTLHNVVDRNRDRYLKAKKMEKMKIVREATEEVRSQGCRFLQKNKKGEFVIASESWVQNKVGHLFRERKRKPFKRAFSEKNKDRDDLKRSPQTSDDTKGLLQSSNTNTDSNASTKPPTGFGFEYLKRKSLTLRSSFKERRSSFSFNQPHKYSREDDTEEDPRSLRATLMEKQRLIFSMLMKKPTDVDPNKSTASTADLSKSSEFPGVLPNQESPDLVAYNDSGQAAAYPAHVPLMNEGNTTDVRARQLPNNLATVPSGRELPQDRALNDFSTSENLEELPIPITSSNDSNTRQSVTMEELATPVETEDIFSFANLVPEDESATNLPSRKSTIMSEAPSGSPHHADTANMTSRQSVTMPDAPSPTSLKSRRFSQFTDEEVNAFIHAGELQKCSLKDPAASKTSMTDAPHTATSSSTRQSIQFTDEDVHAFIDSGELDNFPLSLSALSTPRHSTAAGHDEKKNDLDRLSLSMSEMGIEDLFDKTGDMTPRHSMSESVLTRFSIDNRTSLKVLDDKFRDFIENGDEEEQ
mmetsp:Transcript_5639/g.8686  ORF Transcript_5639/g.8686 Transcript_5639/m.8686 type:complete len:564 (+) Transcript_5639:150-1841(+)|eukprot:CAMPEP_0195293420 /NCGR_PEP_ID=MMETSP0707-20130614/12404_1 /TAXON_ID=33640 /ORGANISM="Asterionellopsis glacialis, Strain CCMP134" /LENGTH=563 /DNA_ID=CAMNT_0040354131 /DNA_START=145 /DNA_END=1836 /DNA_ORIENTATION=-